MWSTSALWVTVSCAHRNRRHHGHRSDERTQEEHDERPAEASDWLSRTLAGERKRDGRPEPAVRVGAPVHVLGVLVGSHLGERCLHLVIR
jgi:hypothetical protein